MLRDYLLIIAAIALIGVGYLFFENTLSQPQKSSITPTPQAVAVNQKFTTSDGRVTIAFPSTWYVSDTTVAGTYGNFGQYTQTFTVTSYKDNTAAIPQNGVKIDFAIEQGGANLPIESLLDCGGKTLTCERVSIANEQFIQSTATLNTGMQTIGVGTFYDQNVLIASAQIQIGDMQAANAKEADKILHSITFNTPTQ